MLSYASVPALPPVDGLKGGLTSTTAPGRNFSNREDLAEHYRSDWHRYNLKRREAGLPVLREEDFRARLEAALAMRREREGREERSGKGHLKKGKDQKKKKKRGVRSGGAVNEESGKAPSAVSSPPTDGEASGARADAGEGRAEPAPMDTDNSGEGLVDASEAADMADLEAEKEEEEEEEDQVPDIDPRQSIFDSFTSATVQSNVDRMSKLYGFFVPDSEFLIDREGLIGYCHEKAKLGRTCLYCQRVFRSWRACQDHMVDSQHAKLRYEIGVDQEDFDVFYDFSAANAEFLGKEKGADKKVEKMEEDATLVSGDDDDNESGEWEDIDEEEVDEVMDEAEEEEEEDDDDDEGLYDNYEAELATHGFDVTPLGELVFPDGRIVGHRGLSRYYKQHIRQAGQTDAVIAARRAAGERVWRGRVVGGNGVVNATSSGSADRTTTLSLARATGLSPGSAAYGRVGGGILVAAASGPGGGGFTQLSLYRYRAAMRKERKGERAGQKIQQKTRLNMNKMDKKANRLHNNVSVAHAKR